MSDPVFEEIAAVLARPKFSRMITSARRGEILDLLRTSTIWFVPRLAVVDCRDAKDNKYLELALASEALAIISGDADLLTLDPWRKTRIMTPLAFLAWQPTSSISLSP